MPSYEEERLANIRENALLLSSLGLEPAKPKAAPAPALPRPQLSSAEQAARRAARERDRQARAEVEPVRRSRRVAASASTSAGARAASSSPTRAGRSASPPRRPLVPRAAAPVIPPTTDDDYSSAPLPARLADGRFVFEGRWAGVFEPNVAPVEMFAGGAFGGGFFAATYSSVLRAPLPAEPDALAYTPPDPPDPPGPPGSPAPRAPFTADPATRLTAAEPDGAANRFGVRAGQSLAEWERAGWIWDGDPRGWAQWYVRFYAGRRCADDERQVRRCRFARALLKKLAGAGGRAAVADEDVGRVLRQTLWQWGYVVNGAEWARYME